MSPKFSLKRRKHIELNKTPQRPTPGSDERVQAGKFQTNLKYRASVMNYISYFNLNV